MIRNILTFQECLDKSSSNTRHLMLGNGFSISLFPNIFNYKVLSEKIKSEKIIKLFKSLKTNDFEYVLRKLTETSNLLRCYKSSKDILLEIESDITELKSTLINVISTSHPENPSSIKEEQYNSCFEFLKNFDEGKKYTFNYDLLLYWVYMHFLDDKDNKLKCDDGFRFPEEDQSIVTWEIGREHKQNIYYIHGAMHIFSNGSEIEKYTWVNNNKTITEQIKESLEKSKYPVFITEGSKKQKQSRINNNSYLGRCFSSIKGIRNNLFIYGHSLRDEDDHIFDFMNSNSKVSDIFISLYGDRSSVENTRIINKVELWNVKYKYKNFYLFQAETAKIWDKNEK